MSKVSSAPALKCESLLTSLVGSNFVRHQNTSFGLSCCIIICQRSLTTRWLLFFCSVALKLIPLCIIFFSCRAFFKVSDRIFQTVPRNIHVSYCGSMKHKSRAKTIHSCFSYSYSLHVPTSQNKLTIKPYYNVTFVNWFENGWKLEGRSHCYLVTNNELSVAFIM